VKRLLLLAAAVVLAGCSGSQNPMTKESVESVLRATGFRAYEIRGGWVTLNAYGQERGIKVVRADGRGVSFSVAIDSITVPRSRYRSSKAPSWTEPICNLTFFAVGRLDPRLDLAIQRLRRRCMNG